MLRLLALLCGLVGAALFAAVALYLVVFLAYYIVPEARRNQIYRTIIGHRYIPVVDAELTVSSDEAIQIDLALLAAFIIPHSLMARRGFKRVWTKIVPQPIERSTYVIVSSLLLATLIWNWESILEVIWPLEGTFLAETNDRFRTTFQVLFWAGWAINVIAVASLGGSDLLGLRQTWAYFRGREYAPPEFRTPGLYRFVRHPAMLGLLIALWATPVMTLGHALFSLVMSLYIFVGIWLEERDLAALYGDAYVQYKRRTSMLLPLRWRRG
jgi:protein-S-isoprenylcysteine O-methyltransferase Ste14